MRGIKSPLAVSPKKVQNKPTLLLIRDQTFSAGRDTIIVRNALVKGKKILLEQRICWKKILLTQQTYKQDILTDCLWPWLLWGRQSASV